MVFLVFMDPMMDHSGGDMQPNFGRKMLIAPQRGKGAERKRLRSSFRICKLGKLSRATLNGGSARIDLEFMVIS
jgi:hypothetical protein